MKKTGEILELPGAESIPSRFCVDDELDFEESQIVTSALTEKMDQLRSFEADFNPYKSGSNVRLAFSLLGGDGSVGCAVMAMRPPFDSSWREERQVDFGLVTAEGGTVVAKGQIPGSGRVALPGWTIESGGLTAVVGDGRCRFYSKDRDCLARRESPRVMADQINGGDFSFLGRAANLLFSAEEGRVAVKDMLVRNWGYSPLSVFEGDNVLATRVGERLTWNVHDALDRVLFGRWSSSLDLAKEILGRRSKGSESSSV